MISSPKEKINERCITRLVHFTDASNIESIIKNGLLPRNQLKDGEYDFNDEKDWTNILMQFAYQLRIQIYIY